MYIILRIIWPAFVVVGLTHPWNGELDTINCIYLVDRVQIWYTLEKLRYGKFGVG